MAKNFFNRYVWLLSTIQRCQPITLEELSSKWQNSSLNEDGKELPARTFHNHRQAIEDIFGIQIKFSSLKRGYCLDSGDDPTAEYKQWLLECIGLNNTLNESASIRDKILVEEVPSNQLWLGDAVDAISGKHCIKLTYKSFSAEEATTFEAHPYCLKLFKQRWYLLAKSEGYNEPRIYSLDRIQNIEVLKKKLIMPANFNAYEFFSNYFGIIADSSKKAEIVKIRVDEDQIKYFESLPLHSTQDVDTDASKKYKDGSRVFSYTIVPTFDFKQELLRHGSSIEVLSPSWFRKELKGEIAAMARRYR